MNNEETSLARKLLIDLPLPQLNNLQVFQYNVRRRYEIARKGLQQVRTTRTCCDIIIIHVNTNIFSFNVSVLIRQ